MGQAFSPEECVEVFWEQHRQVLVEKIALTEEELEDLTRDWYWVQLRNMSHPYLAKTHLYWVPLGVRYYKGWRVF